MDVNSAITQAVSNTATRVGDAVTMRVLDKTMDLQVQSAVGLLEAATQSAPPAADPDSALGHNINILA